MKFTVLFGLSFLSFSLAAPSATLAKRETAIQATDRLLFSTSIGNFEAARNARNPNTVDWSSDGCSSSPDNPIGFDFLASCHRHDFGYRNYKAQSRFTDANKLRIDNNFKTDLYNQCANESFESACRALANVYYEAVRIFGTKKATELLEQSAREMQAVKVRSVE